MSKTYKVKINDEIKEISLPKAIFCDDLLDKVGLSHKSYCLYEGKKKIGLKDKVFPNVEYRAEPKKKSKKKDSLSSSKSSAVQNPKEDDDSHPEKERHQKEDDVDDIVKKQKEEEEQCIRKQKEEEERKRKEEEERQKKQKEEAEGVKKQKEEEEKERLRKQKEKEDLKKQKEEESNKKQKEEEQPKKPKKEEKNQKAKEESNTKKKSKSTKKEKNAQFVKIIGYDGVIKEIKCEKNDSSKLVLKRYKKEVKSTKKVNQLFDEDGRKLGESDFVTPGKTYSVVNTKKSKESPSVSTDNSPMKFTPTSSSEISAVQSIDQISSTNLPISNLNSTNDSLSENISSTNSTPKINNSKPLILETRWEYKENFPDDNNSFYKNHRPKLNEQGLAPSPKRKDMATFEKIQIL